ncbi:uncharacterized protein PHACADRAFT_32832 [Phanerochaete carnosa HHB-10118-sp]|uniref:Fork-head domain-containing protein n=1 Tax=Phanerochaete carnosa (strain HHB-10118-sp) TaxID=650164 RepID=K5WIB1_PHACS|nr:uncharacterized protein PHACADRAFT_32832 [Phanerochaete carnosa HHB-10118-sp]EKM49972.1 hypothetical protein PHACADRAFT_32832 [Phanerochaete carnosa HHB-10118-sp]
MADPHPQHNPASPISSLLRTLGLTREDLVLHTEQMRAYLSRGSSSQPLPESTVQSRSLRRSRTVSFSHSFRKNTPPTPPKTPVKAEPVEHTIFGRQMDTMERVLEGKSKQTKKERRESKSRSRDSRRVSQAYNLTPSRSRTPQLIPVNGSSVKRHSRNYLRSAIVVYSTVWMVLMWIILMRSQDVVAKVAPGTPRRSTRAATLKAPSSRLPKTPINRHVLSQPSSSHTSTPQSSPARIVNIVSSPGPMRDTPDSEEDELDDLPYTLPPGPYSKEKPDFSYAALIGQAILSSPEHRLTLQDIYEWITTVYPYYTRGEQTWMNSIRHALSTMAVFRKITRGRNEGKSLWAIWDCDIPCFANGGFRKSLCADMAKAKPATTKSGPKRKFSIDDTLTRDGKKRKRSVGNGADIKFTPFSSLSHPAPIIPPFYTPMYANAQQQPYYRPYVPPLPPLAPIPVSTPASAAVSAEALFPPLPPTSAYHRAMSLSQPSSASVSRAGSVETGPPDTISTAARTASPEPSKLMLVSSSSSSVPELTSSSSSASSPPLSSLGSSGIGESIAQRTPGPAAVDTEDEVDKLTAQWLASPGTIDALNSSFHSKANRDKPETPVKGSARSRKGLPFIVPEAPESPTTEWRKIAKGKQRMRSPSPTLMYPTPETANLPRLSTPPPRPCTPSRQRKISGSTAIQLSPQRTPLSHRGLHMSPSPSLAHYKSNLDPPPAAVFLPQAPLLSGMPPPDDTGLTLPHPRTPSRKRTPKQGGSGSKTNGVDLSPFTPKRLFGGIDSPFRTPSSHFHDPYNPATLLEEEISRLNSQEFTLQDSPESSLFGKHGALYDSPSIPSPSRYW